MKKNTLFFKTLGLFVTAMVSFSVVSCTKDDDAKREIDSVWEEVGNDAVVGTWQWSTTVDLISKATTDRTITFNEDYTGQAEVSSYRSDGNESHNYTFNYRMIDTESGYMSIGVNLAFFAIFDGELYINSDDSFSGGPYTK